MSAPIIPVVLLGVNVALGVALGSLWVDPDGQLRNVTWQAPEPLKPELAAPLSAAEPAQAMDLTRFAATLERPLFSPSRRPPPPPGAAPPPPPPDPLANFHLYGVYGGAETGGMLARIEGKTRRIALNETFGGWTLKGIQDREVTLSRGDETRTLKLVQAKPAPPRPPAVAAGAPNPAAGAAPAATAGGTRAQQREEQIRDRLRRRNEIRARAGLPLLTQ